MIVKHNKIADTIELIQEKETDEEVKAFFIEFKKQYDLFYKKTTYTSVNKPTETVVKACKRYNIKIKKW